MTEPTQEQPVVTPEVTTAPAGSGWSRIPDHLGRARTSTVVLALLFLAIGTLYLNIRPNTTGVATTGNVNQAPVSTTAPAPEPTATTTPAPETTPEQSTESATTSGSPDTTSPDTTTPDTTRATLPTTTPTGTSTRPTPTLPSPAG